MNVLILPRAFVCLGKKWRMICIAQCCTIPENEILLSPLFLLHYRSFPLSQGSQHVSAAGTGNRDDAALQGSLFWSSPDAGGDWMLPKPSLHMGTGECREDEHRLWFAMHKRVRTLIKNCTVDKNLYYFAHVRMV